LEWFDPENHGTVVIYIAHEKDQQRRKRCCMQKAVPLVHFSGKRRPVTGVTNCGHSPDASAGSIFHWTQVPVLLSPDVGARFTFTGRMCQIHRTAIPF